MAQENISNCRHTFMLAIKNGNLDTVKSLVEKGFNLHLSNDYGCALLSAAVVSKHYEVFSYIFQEMLINNPKNLQEDKKTFGLACCEENPEIVGKFLDSKLFDVNDTVLNGLTPLLLAVSNGCLEVAKILLNAGANKYSKNQLMQTCYDISVYRKDKKMQTLLSEKSVSTSLTPMRSLNNHVFIISPDQPIDGKGEKRKRLHKINCNNPIAVNLYEKYPEFFNSEDNDKEKTSHSYCHCHYIKSLLSPIHFDRFTKKRGPPFFQGPEISGQKKSKLKMESYVLWSSCGKALFKRSPNKTDAINNKETKTSGKM